MDKIAIKAKTLTGEIVIAGRLQRHKDLSFDLLARDINLQAFELGRNLYRYQKLSKKTLSKEFDVKNRKSIRLLSSDKQYVDMLIGTSKDEMYLNRYDDCLPCNF